MGPSAGWNIGATLLNGLGLLTLNRDTEPTGTESSINALRQLQMQSVQQEANAQEQQAQQVLTETEQLVRQKQREANTVTGQQAQAYLNSGVTLKGTPADVINYTRRLAAEEEAALRNRGAALVNLARTRSAQIVNQGRAQLLGLDYDMTVARAQNRLRGATALGTGVTQLVTGLGNAIPSTSQKTFFQRLLGGTP